MRTDGARDGALGMPHGGPTREPGWLLWCATVDCKLGRLPRHQTPLLSAWECSGPECEALVSDVLEAEAGELWADRARAARCGRRQFGEAREAQIREVRQALGELVRSRAYAVAMERLRWELAEAMDDPSFAGAWDRLQRREAE